LVDTQKFRNTLGYEYKLLGVVAGFMPEKNDFTIQVVTDYSGSFKENSGICAIVPAQELRKILFSSDLSRKRDQAVTEYPRTK
jgi:hypothetical protein